MGLITGLLTLPVSGPVWCFRLIIERIAEEAAAAMHDENRGYAELMDLSMRRSAGKVTDAEFAEQEAALFARLNSIREYKEELLNAELEMADEDLDTEELLNAELAMTDEDLYVDSVEC